MDDEMKTLRKLIIYKTLPERGRAGERLGGRLQLGVCVFVCVCVCVRASALVGACS